MAYVITQRCCNDAGCVTECPVDCIRPRPEDPEFATAEMLHIDPDTCIDCGACVEACPVDAIHADEELPDALARYAEINAAWFAHHPLDSGIAPVDVPRRLSRDSGALRVAIVGTGPAACYAAENLVGRGNVALDVARVLTADPDRLTATDIAAHAIEALRHSRIREVVLLGRRPLANASFSGPEFLALGHLPDTDIVIDPADIDDRVRAALDDPGTDPALRLKLRLATEYAGRETGDRKRIVFRFLTSPTALSGTDRVTGIDCVRNEMAPGPTGLVPTPVTGAETVETALVLRAIGYRGKAVADLPFDEVRGVIPHEHGRVIDAAGTPVPGAYVSGWIKRGPRGVIGSDRRDAEETVTTLVDDFTTGRLGTPSQDREALAALLTRRCPDRVDRDGWAAIDAAEKANGAHAGRPREKFTRVADLVAAARA